MIYILAEGHGEIEASTKLVYKIWHNLNLPKTHIGKAIRWKNLHQDQGIKKGIEYIRSKKDVSGLLILRDDEDNCPATIAPLKSKFIITLNVNFPISYVIMYREYETLFVAYLKHFMGKSIPHLIRGNIDFSNNIAIPHNPESIRDAKGLISSALSGTTSYKPTTDQLSLTQAIDINLLRQTQLPSFGSLERAILNLSNNQNSFVVYP